MDIAIINQIINRKTIHDSKNELLYSVPYHPDTNSIGEFLSQLKYYIKKETPNTYNDKHEYISNKNYKGTFNKLLKHSYRIYK